MGFVKTGKGQSMGVIEPAPSTTSDPKVKKTPAPKAAAPKAKKP